MEEGAQRARRGEKPACENTRLKRDGYGPRVTCFVLTLRVHVPCVLRVALG